MSNMTLRPGVRCGSYPQKKERMQGELEHAVSNFFARLQTRLKRKKYKQNYVAKKVKQHAAKLQLLSEQEFTENIQSIRSQMHRNGLKTELIFEAFAIIREASGRTLGKQHFDVQLYGGWLMINGMLAEMDTGEGKTLTTTLPACTAALAGIPVHVITANDYLAERDAQTMTELYQRLGLTAGSVIDGMETDLRQQSYQCDIVHTTNQQIAFDYLRDRIEVADDTGDLRFQFRQIQRSKADYKGAPLLLRGLCFALIDEADSVLIDEAITPLIITKAIANEENTETYNDALYLASTLFIDTDFVLNKKLRSVEITKAGHTNLDSLCLTLPKQWRLKRKREVLVKQALAASYFYLKDKQYVVNDSTIQIIDESTGRIMADRAWEQGLHQMIEAKEGCQISQQREPQARISYQRFYSRYLQLGGASGTISEVAQELSHVYGLDVQKVATNQPSKRKLLSEKIYRNEAIKQKALLKRIKQLYHKMQPILIGTSSVLESEQVSSWLEKANFPHRVLNAKQDHLEAEIIAHAGEKQAITVATNMAGRGTDIKLGDGVEKLGGLHVIAISRNSSHRVDRQLYGRCARQGDPGSAEAILSLQDTSMEQFYSSTMLRLLSIFCPADYAMPAFITRLVLNLPQQKNELQQSQMRKQLMKQDRQLRRILAFSGKFE